MTIVESRSDVGAACSLLMVQLVRGARRRIEEAVAPTGLRLNEVLALVLDSDRSDRRRAIVALAAPGEQLLAQVDRAFRQVDDEILAGLTLPERQTLTGLLSDLVGHIAAGSPQPLDETR